MIRRRLRNGTYSPLPPLPKQLKSAPIRAVGRRRKALSLPQELIDHIIDYSRDQRETLQACASVCRAFVRRSQQHLFAKIILYPSLEQKLKKLFDSSPHLANYTHDLSISISVQLSQLDFFSATHADARSYLFEILSMFTHLNRFTIKTYGYGVIDWQKGISMDIQTGVASVFLKNMLHEFVLQDVQHFDALLLARCGSLRMLVLGGEANLAPYKARVPDPCSPPAVSVAMVGAGENCFQSFVDCCRASPPAFYLDNLQWLGVRELPGESWIKSFEQLAKTSLSTLKHLVIELEIKTGAPGGYHSPTMELERIDLSGLKSLSTIEIRNNSYDHDQTLFGQRSARILQSLPKPSLLTKITFYCPGQQFATHQSPSRQGHWENVDLVLSNGFSCLTQVHFKFGVNVFPSAPNLLPLLTSRNIVTRLSRMFRTV